METPNQQIMRRPGGDASRVPSGPELQSALVLANDPQNSIDQRREEEEEEWLTLEQHMLEMDTAATNFQRILDRKAELYEHALRQRFQREQDRSKLPKLQEIIATKGLIIHKDQPNRPKERSRPRPAFDDIQGSGYSLKEARNSILSLQAELEARRASQETRISVSGPVGLKSPRAKTSHSEANRKPSLNVDDTASNTSSALTGFQHLHTTQGQQKSGNQSPVSLPFATTLGDTSLGLSRSPGGAVLSSESSGALPSSSSTQPPSSPFRNLGTTSNNSPLALPRASPTSLSISALSKGLAPSSSSASTVLSPEAEAALHQRAQSMVDEPIEKENSKLRELVLSKQAKLQALQQEAFFVGVPSEEIANAIGQFSPINRPKRRLGRNMSESQSRKGSTMEGDGQQAEVNDEDDENSANFGEEQSIAVDGDAAGAGGLGSSSGSAPRPPRRRRPGSRQPRRLGDMKATKLVDPHVILTPANREQYFSVSQREDDINKLERELEHAEEFIKKAFREGPDESFEKVEEAKAATQTVRLLLNEMHSEKRSYEEVLKFLADAARADIVEQRRIARKADENASKVEEELKTVLREYLKKVVERDRKERFEKAEQAALLAAIPAGDKAIQCSLELDDVKDTTAFLTRISQQEGAIRRIATSVEVLLAKLHESNERFESVLLCRRCECRPQGNNTMFALWPCGHTICEGCLAECEIDFGEYLCEECQNPSTDVPNDVVNCIIARSDFKRSGYSDLMEALENFRDAVIDIDTNFIQNTVTQYVTMRPSEEFRPTYMSLDDMETSHQVELDNAGGATTF